MALKLLQPNGQPFGQFDGKDSEALTLKGGEVVTFGSTAVPGTDLASFDSFDGYTNTSGSVGRPVVTRTLVAGSRPLFLADEGITGYGTLFGVVLGGSVGQQVNGPNTYTGAVLGPHTATGSGKVTCWGNPGMFAVSLDAVDTAATGLVPTNTSMATGTALTYTATGLLTPVGSANAVGSAPVVGRFVSFDTNGSLVTSTNSMVTALNSPSGSAAVTRSFQFATFYWNPPST
jgi:hypothetical protein